MSPARGQLARLLRELRSLLAFLNASHLRLFLRLLGHCKSQFRFGCGPLGCCEALLSIRGDVDFADENAPKIGECFLGLDVSGVSRGFKNLHSGRVGLG